VALAQHSSVNNDWGTPSIWLDRVKITLGAIDLDPASDEQHNARVGAKFFYTEKQNGLRQGWHGRVFLNPPGGRGIPKLFFEKLVQEYMSTAVEAGIYLGYSLEQLLWSRKILEHIKCDIAIPQKRVHFVGAGNSPTHGNYFLLLADNALTRNRFSKAFESTCLMLASH
jgi:hypothetical protein